MGRQLCATLRATGFAVREMDLLGEGADYGDITRTADICSAISGCIGVVHLAAVSRVVWGQRDPELCWRTNVTGVQNLIQVASSQHAKPWVLIASSREVYGQAQMLPVNEDSPLSPLNVYARSKAAGEKISLAARQQGLQTAVVRLSNVYGSTHDHADRVIPAFAKSSIEGKPLHVEGSQHTFDFTHVDDVVRGIDALIASLCAGNRFLPPVHLVSGSPTSLGELAALCKELAGSESNVSDAAPRSYDVAQFYGDPTRALELLGWKAEIPLAKGLKRLIDAFRHELHMRSVKKVAA